ncbi:hypothetical protein IJ182_11125 [bacterium]|nr:hypothetical protein [bacterium]
MNIFNYLNDIKIKINNINSFLLKQKECNTYYNPFLYTIKEPATYVWLEKENI